MSEIPNHEDFMKEAIAEAQKSLSEGGEPIGSVLVLDGNIIGRGHNQRVQENSAIRHAEMDCLESAGRLSVKDYKRCVLYSTLSPCDMCTGAILLYKIPTVVIGENENFKGPEEYSISRGVQIVNLDLDECKSMMKKYIEDHPDIWFEDIGE